MTRKRFQKLLISEGVSPRKARNYKFDRSKMIFAYSVDYGKSYYLSCGESYQELWDNLIFRMNGHYSPSMKLRSIQSL